MKTKKYVILQIEILSILVLLLISSRNLYTQSCYHPFVDSILSKISLQEICKTDRELSGDTSTIINGLPYTIISRTWNTAGNVNAGIYIFNKFKRLGYKPEYQSYNLTGTNIVAKKTGTKFPNQQIIICAHYDDLLSYGVQSDTMPGADDNASGTSGVLEIARVLAPYTFDYTIVFAAWDEEEAPAILSGSRAYADSAFAHGDSIICVLNLDMIAYDANNDYRLKLGKDTLSYYYGSLLNSVMNIYLPELNPYFGPLGSDEMSFANKGYKSLLLIEGTPDFNPYYHTREESFDKLNPQFFVRMVKAATAWLITVEDDYTMNFSHIPLETNSDTSGRIANVKITSGHGIAGIDPYNSLSCPKLYYKISDGAFSYVNYFSIDQDTFKFIIPGQPRGTKVSYYFAAQSIEESFTGSLPEGARGIDPPGSIPPENFFVYYVTDSISFCSNSVPKDILPKQLSYDTIFISNFRQLLDVNVNLTINHTNDSDLFIWIARPDDPILQLSTGNGGSGDDYINTTFDDEAVDSIIHGIAPFTGYFRPEQALTLFDYKSIEGPWMLRIYNNSADITGQLISWCIKMDTYNPLGITNNNIPVKFSLQQNYPNPFNPVTKIDYSLLKASDVKIIVYDILGREVQTLVNDKFNAGNYTINFNGENLSSGIYFYSMLIDGVLFNTKRMVLLK